MEGSGEKRPKPRGAGNFGATPVRAAQMRIVSAGTFWPSRRGLLRYLKYIIRARIPERPRCPATQWVVSMHPFCLGLATTSARAALRPKAGRQPLCQRPSHAPHFWRAVFHSNVSRLQCQQSHTLSVRCRAARGRQPSWRSPRAYRVEWPHCLVRERALKALIDQPKLEAAKQVLDD